MLIKIKDIKLMSFKIIELMKFKIIKLMKFSVKVINFETNKLIKHKIETIRLIKITILIDVVIIKFSVAIKCIEFRDY